MDIIQIAKTALEQKYGTKPSRKITVRFNEEIRLLQQHHFKSLFTTAYETTLSRKNDKRIFYVAGTGAASFLTYLLGISRVNPLPAHYYCPRCKQIILGSEKYGWDLPSQVCVCGTCMERNGYDIAKEYFWNKAPYITKIAIAYAGHKPSNPWVSRPFSEQLDLWAFLHNSITNRGESYHPDDCVEQMAKRPFLFAYRDDIVDFLLQRNIPFQEAFAVADHIRCGKVANGDFLPLIREPIFSKAQISEFEKTSYLYSKVHAIESLLAVETQDM